MNFNLTQIIVDNSETQPQLVYYLLYEKMMGFIKKYVFLIFYYNFPFLKISLKNCFIRGSVIRMIHIPGHEVDTELLEDACKKEMKQEKLG